MVFMKDGLEFYIVDVFGTEKYSGNQLAVVILNEGISKERMQRIANEFHFSETTFVELFNSEGGVFKVNIFTPKNELPFAGHPTLGTAFVIRNEVLKNKTGDMILSLGVGKIPVIFDDELVWMKQLNPTFGTIRNPEDIAPVLNISPDEIDCNYPVQDVSTGIEFTIVPLKTLKSVKSASTNMANYKKYFANSEPREFFIFSPETYDKNNRLNCRMFADNFGIPEDPATGSAGGCLAGYLVKHNYFHTKEINIRVEQGYEMGRGSILHLYAGERNGLIDVKVGGKVFKIAEGRLV
jgi:trans-2,3-dihydro-3-hydroxyanthranilate isomerase